MNLTNPYYSPEPFLTGYPIKIATVSVLFNGALNFYCCLFKPSKLSPALKGLLIYHVAISSGLSVCTGFLSYPIMLLPYFAFHGIGIATQLGISQIFQFALMMTLLFSCCSSVGITFFYRIKKILPVGHILNRYKSIEIIIYIWYESELIRLSFRFFPITYLCHFPLIYLMYDDQQRVKEALFSKYRIIYPNFFTDQVFAVDTSDNVWFIALAATCGLYLITFVAITSCGSLIFYSFLRAHRKNVSGYTQRSQNEIAIQMLALAFWFTYGGLFTILPMQITVFSSSYRVDIFIAAEFNGTVSIAGVLGTFIVGYRPFRQAVFSPFLRKIPKQRVLNSKKSVTKL